MRFTQEERLLLTSLFFLPYQRWQTTRMQVVYINGSKHVQQVLLSHAIFTLAQVGLQLTQDVSITSPSCKWGIAQCLKARK